LQTFRMLSSALVADRAHTSMASPHLSYTDPPHRKFIGVSNKICKKVNGT
jgi:hypothetical protein